MDKAKRDSLSATETVTVDASTHGAKRPFNPSDIVELDGTIFYVEKEHRRIGFLMFSFSAWHCRDPV